MNTETQQAILAEVMAEIERRPKYQFELVYIDYRDGFDQEGVDALARGDWETLDGLTDDWIDQARWEGAQALLTDIIGELEDEWDESVLNDWMHTDAAHEAYEAIMDRDESTPLEDLARNSGNVLLRVRPPESGDYTYEDDESEVHYWIAAVMVSDLWDIWTGNAERVKLTKAYAWRGDVWNGGGWVDDEPTENVIVNRTDLRTDHGASGYSWTEVCGGTSPRYYEEAKIEAVEEVNA